MRTHPDDGAVRNKASVYSSGSDEAVKPFSEELISLKLAAMCYGIRILNNEKCNADRPDAESGWCF